ncbi:MAG: YggT family protein, partial [Waddliaceae bacterium]
DPYLNFFRRFIPPLGVIDLSPIVAFLCLRLFIQPMMISFVHMVISLFQVR